jgi:allantoicase
LPKIPLDGNSHHYYGIEATDDVYTHVKLNMYPDGGIVSEMLSAECCYFFLTMRFRNG